MLSNRVLWSSSSHETVVLMVHFLWPILVSLRLLSLLCLQWNLLVNFPSGLGSCLFTPEGGFLNTLDRALFILGPTERGNDLLMVPNLLLSAWQDVFSCITGPFSELGLSVDDPWKFSLPTSSKLHPRGNFCVPVNFWSDLFLKDRSRFGSRGFLSGLSRQSWVCGPSLAVCVIFSGEVTPFWRGWFCSEKIEPEQLWVLSRGRHSSETHFLLPVQSDVVGEFKVRSVDLFLLRKCLLEKEKNRCLNSQDLNN